MILKKAFRLLSIIIIAALILGGCAKNNSNIETDKKLEEKKFTIVTSFYPIYISVINVTKDIPDVQVVNMTKSQTGCLHDYQLMPEDMKIIEKANAFVINGAGMEAFMKKITDQHPDIKIVDASHGIELLKDANGNENPHVWVSVSNAILQVKNIEEQLSKIDPSNADNYKKNAQGYTKKLEALRDRMHKELDGIKNRDIITLHEAFPYFSKEFNLNIADIIEREPGSEPSPAEREETIKIIKKSGIKVIFGEPQYSARAADTISRETGAKVYTLDPGVTGEATPDAYDEYINLMEKNLNSLREALK